MKITNTKSIATRSINAVVYAPSGTGKTTLVRTLRKPLLISAEGGTLSLAGEDIDTIEVRTMAEVNEAIQYAAEHASEYGALAIDSFTEIAKMKLAEEQEKNKGSKDNWAPFRALNDELKAFLRYVRDLPIDVYVTALATKDKDAFGLMYWNPECPGSQLSGELTSIFDEVFVLKAIVAEDKSVSRWLQTYNDGQWVAKDRSGKLDQWEEPNLTHIFNKIRGIKEA